MCLPDVQEPSEQSWSSRPRGGSIPALTCSRRGRTVGPFLPCAGAGGWMLLGKGHVGALQGGVLGVPLIWPRPSYGDTST